jgi:hypothetical protein
LVAAFEIGEGDVPTSVEIAHMKGLPVLRNGIRERINSARVI